MDVALADSFIEAQRKLDPSQLRAVQDAVSRLLKGGGAQVDLHHLKDLPYVAFSVTRGAMRVIALEEAGTLLLLHVGAHDDAYAWAARHRVVKVGAVLRVLPTAAEDPPATPAPKSAQAPSGPLASLRPRDLARLELGPSLASWLRSVPDEDVLMDLASTMRPALGEALVSLAADPDDLQAIVHTWETASAAPTPTPTLQDILRDPRNAARLWVPPPGEEALALALEGDFESWQLFLHPSQRRIVELDARGSVKVTGGPGTGKTVVALHRARHLLEHVFADDPRPILLTAFSRPLVAELERAFARLVRDQPRLLDRVRFSTATSVAQQVLQAAGQPHTFLEEEDLLEAWRDAHADDALGFDVGFYRRERERVVIDQGAWTLEAYRKAPRRGLGTRLSGAQRLRVWPVLEAFERALDARGGADDAGLARRARVLVDADPSNRPFAAIICDELQDLAPESARLLAGLAADRAGEPRPNGLFLVGDGYQRIFRRPVPLARCGIDVRGRSRHLRLNYRTTEGLRAAAVRVIEGQSLDPLDDATEHEGELASHQRYRSVRPGPPPERRTVESEAEEIALVVERLEGETERTLVLGRSRTHLDRVSAGLAERGVPHLRLRGGDVEPEKAERVVLATMHRAKGLEAAQVILLSDVRAPRRPSELDAEEWKRRQSSLTYVAITRARDRCVILERAQSG